MIALAVAKSAPIDLDGTPIDPLAHGGLVVTVVNRYRRSGMDREDLDQAGNLGLIEAYHRYDRTLGFKFCTYAVYWIRLRVRLEAYDAGRPFHLPSNAYELIAKLNNGVDPREEKKITDDTVDATIRAYASRTVRDHEDGSRVSGRLADLRERPPADVAVDRATVADLLRCLTGREREVIVGLYGLDGRAPGNFEEIGREMGFTPQRARQIAYKSLDKLRRRAGSNYKGSSRMWDGRKTASARRERRGAACRDD